MSNLVSRPPESIEISDYELLNKLVFLAGPIQGAADWQQDAIEIFDSLTDELVIASPRRDSIPSGFEYDKQVDWETHHLRRAGRLGAVMFWLAGQTEETPSRAYAQTTRFELGEWKIRHETRGTKLVIGIEEDFGNNRYIGRRLSQDCPDLPILSSLPDTCAATLELIRTTSD